MQYRATLAVESQKVTFFEIFTCGRDARAVKVSAKVRYCNRYWIEIRMQFFESFEYPIRFVCLSEFAAFGCWNVAMNRKAGERKRLTN
jgi:hypothetical protein